MIPSAVQARVLVVLGLEEQEADLYISQLNGLVGKEHFTEKNTKIEKTVAVSMQENTKTVNELISKINNVKINGKKLQAFSASRYMAMYEVGKATKSQESIEIKPAVKKIIGEKEVAEWRSEALGEQFIIYNEGVFSNYQLSKMFPCKLIKTKAIKDVNVTVEEDLIIVQKQKNIFVYGGYMELLDGFVVDDLITYHVIGKCIIIGNRPEPAKQVWSIHHIYTKSLVKTVEIPKDAAFFVSAGLTHYLISHENTIEIRALETDENILPEYSQKEEGKKVKGFVSPHDNAVFVVKSTEMGMGWLLYSLTTGEVIRKKVFTNIEKYSVVFAEKEVAIINTRNIAGKISHFMDVWSVDGQKVISKALGENIKSVHFSKYTTIVLSQATCKVYKKEKNLLSSEITIKEPISKVDAGEITVLLDPMYAYVIGIDGTILSKLKVEGITNIKVSPFGLYVALLANEQVRIVDICGKEVFAANIEKNNGFFWRTVVKPTKEISLAEEEIQKYKAEDAQRKKEARKQFMKENKEKIQEWREFLNSMIEFRSSVLSTH